MSNVESSRVISKRRRTVGLEIASARRPPRRVTLRRPVRRTLRPVESMNSTSVRSRTIAIASWEIASSRRCANSCAVLTWISPFTWITCVRASRLSEDSSKCGMIDMTCGSGVQVNPTCRRARRQGGCTVEYVAGTVATPVILKPRMRGVLHQWACAASVVLGVLVVVFADGGRETRGRGGLRGERHRALRRERAVPPRELAPRGPALDAPPRPLDDLRPHRGDLHAVRAAGVRRRRRPRAAHRGVVRRGGRGGA